MSNSRNSTYSPSMNMPGSSVPRSGRGVFAMLLCFLLPPLGLMFLWRKGVFMLRGRVLITLLATVEMMIIAVLLTPASVVSTVTPIPGSAERYTAASESDALTALSNMDELIRQQQAAEAGETYISPVDQAAQLAQQQEILNTIVYTYNGSGARYYHSVTVCGNQSNLRSRTVQEALAKQLGPCPDCNPPVYSQLGAVGGN